MGEIVSMPISPGIFQRIGRFLDGVIYSFSASIGAIFFGLGCAYVGSYDHTAAWAVVKHSTSFTASFIAYVLSNPNVALAVGIPATLFGGIGMHIKMTNLASKNTDLEDKLKVIPELESKIESEQIDSQNLKSEIYRVHQELVATWLKGIAKQVGLDSNSRVSIYYEFGESFYLLSRYSLNPKLAKSHKQKFSLNHGVISLAWQHGEYAEDNSPEYQFSNENYIQYMMDKYDYHREVIELINMKSCQYFALAITEAGDNIGVILFESEIKGNISDKTKDEIRDYCTDYQSHLCRFVKQGIKYDKSINAKKFSENTDNDSDILNMLGGEK